MREFFNAANILQLGVTLITAIIAFLIKKLLNDIKGLGKKTQLVADKLSNTNERLARIEGYIEGKDRQHASLQIRQSP